MSQAASAALDIPAIDGAIFNVADALQHVLLPQLSGGAQARAAECVTILARALTDLRSAAEIPASAGDTVAAWRSTVSADVEALRAHEQRIRELEEKVRTVQTSGARHFDQARFEGYLRHHPLGGSEARVISAKQLAGGRSKQTILIEQRGASGLPEQLVVRQDWASAVTGTSVVTEFELLKRVWEFGIKVPQPLLLESSAEPLGAPFIVVARMPGAGQGTIFDPPLSEKLALQVATELGKLHALPVADFDALKVPTEAYRAEQLRSGLAGFRGLQEKLGLPRPMIAIAMDWLERNVDRVDGPRAILHNDLGCHNFLIEGEDLRAFLDWELAHVGNPGADLGYIRGWISKMVSWDKFMATYHAAGGPPISDITLDFYTIWCGVRLYSLLIQARAGVAMGVVRDTEVTFAATAFMAQQLDHIGTQLQQVLARNA